MHKPLIFTFAAFLVLVSFGARAMECVPVVTPRLRLVDEATKGYVPVVVTIKIPLAESLNPLEEARKGDFTFWMEGTADGVRGNTSWNLQQVKSCTGVVMFSEGKLLDDHMMLFTVRALVLDGQEDEHSFKLATGLFLPKSMVDKHPHAGTTLKSGITFRGEWGTVRDLPAIIFEEAAK